MKRSEKFKLPEGAMIENTWWSYDSSWSDSDVEYKFRIQWPKGCQITRLVQDEAWCAKYDVKVCLKDRVPFVVDANNVIHYLLSSIDEASTCSLYAQVKFLETRFEYTLTLLLQSLRSASGRDVWLVYDGWTGLTKSHDTKLADGRQKCAFLRKFANGAHARHWNVLPSSIKRNTIKLALETGCKVLLCVGEADHTVAHLANAMNGIALSGDLDISNVANKVMWPRDAFDVYLDPSSTKTGLYTTYETLSDAIQQDEGILRKLRSKTATMIPSYKQPWKTVVDRHYRMYSMSDYESYIAKSEPKLHLYHMLHSLAECDNPVIVLYPHTHFNPAVSGEDSTPSTAEFTKTIRRAKYALDIEDILDDIEIHPRITIHEWYAKRRNSTCLECSSFQLESVRDIAACIRRRDVHVFVRLVFGDKFAKYVNSSTTLARDITNHQLPLEATQKSDSNAIGINRLCKETLLHEWTCLLRCFA